jgi:hypothetical protein
MLTEDEFVGCEATERLLNVFRGNTNLGRTGL